jgi:hypothetical protein
MSPEGKSPESARSTLGVAGSAIVALLCCGLTACGGSHRGEDAASATNPTTSIGQAAHTATSARRLLNDGDAEKMHDSDLDDSTADHEDHDADSTGEYEEGNGNGKYHDGDDLATVSFGHAASATDRHAIATLVKRYYAAAAAGDGAKACSMMASPMARSLPQTSGGGAAPAYLRGAKTCEAVAVRVFAHARPQIDHEVVVTGVRVQGGTVVALLGSTKAPASVISLGREGGAWKIEALLGGPLP